MGYDTARGRLEVFAVPYQHAHLGCYEKPRNRPGGKRTAGHDPIRTPLGLLPAEQQIKMVASSRNQIE
jgi:hypothetical protein